MTALDALLDRLFPTPTPTPPHVAPAAVATAEPTTPPYSAVSAVSAASAVSAVEEAMRVIQTHLDREAHNRRMRSLQPQELCPDQKSELVRDLRAALDL